MSPPSVTLASTEVVRHERSRALVARHRVRSLTRDATGVVCLVWLGLTGFLVLAHGATAPSLGRLTTALAEALPAGLVAGAALAGALLGQAVLLRFGVGLRRSHVDVCVVFAALARRAAPLIALAIAALGVGGAGAWLAACLAGLAAAQAALELRGRLGGVLAVAGVALSTALVFGVLPAAALRTDAGDAAAKAALRWHVAMDHALAGTHAAGAAVPPRQREGHGR